jgi:hypothetical protein
MLRRRGAAPTGLTSSVRLAAGEPEDITPARHVRPLRHCPDFGEGGALAVIPIRQQARFAYRRQAGKARPCPAIRPDKSRFLKNIRRARIEIFFRLIEPIKIKVIEV